LDRLEWGITGRRPSSRPKPEPVPEPISQKSDDNQVIERKAKRGWLIGLAAVIFTGLLLGVIYKISILPSTPSSVANLPESPKLASSPATPPVATKQEPVSPTKDPALAPGKEFQDKLKDGTLGPKMVVIPAGSFLMGSPPNEPERGSTANERQHKVDVKAFAIGKYEVTFEEYDRFAEATGREKPSDEGWGRGSRPVINVSWYDAVAYAEWMSTQTGQRYRLPTEAEWEYAARAGTQTAYWWGVAPGSNRANCDGCGSRWDSKQTAPVGSFSANPFGLYDTAGNVWEWTCSAYDKDYGGKELSCTCSEPSGPCVLRGGSWHSDPRGVRGAARGRTDPLYGGVGRGFRLART